MFLWYNHSMKQDRSSAFSTPRATRRAFLRGGACALVAATARPFAARAAAELGPLPAYWTDYLPGIADRINAFKTVTDDAFFFLTDVHMHANRCHSGRILADLIARTRFRNVYCGGDVPVAYGDKATSSTSLDGALEKYRTYVVDPVVAAGGRYYGAKGNHDFTINAVNGGTTYGTGTSHTYSAAFARDFIMARDPRPFAVTNAADPVACYYYRDAPHARLRYIVIDTSDGDIAESTKAWAVPYKMREGQIDWLARHALATLPAGWHAIVMGHIPIGPVVGTEYNSAGYNFAAFHSILAAYNARRAVSTSSGTSYDFTGAQGRILFCLSGHWHADRFTCHDGILHITQCCDAAYSNYINDSPFCGTLPRQTSGTVNEHAIDCYQSDTSNGLVYATRIGAGGQSRVFHAHPTSVPAGGTRTFAATHLTGPLTWACYDGDRCTYGDKKSTVEERTVFYHDHLVSVENGTLTAGTAGHGIVVAMDAQFNKEVFCVAVV